MRVLGSVSDLSSFDDNKHVDFERAKKKKEQDNRKLMRAWEFWKGVRRARETAETNAERVNIRIAAYKVSRILPSSPG